MLWEELGVEEGTPDDGMERIILGDIVLDVPRPSFKRRQGGGSSPGRLIEQSALDEGSTSGSGAGEL